MRRIGYAWLAAFCLYLGVLYTLPHRGAECLPETMRTWLHDDYPFLLRKLPRKANVICGIDPPIMVAGNQKYIAFDKNGKQGPKRVPREGEWQLSLIQIRFLVIPYFGVQKYGWHFRIGGCHWDDLDNYYSCPSVTLKPIDPPWELVLYNTTRG